MNDAEFREMLADYVGGELDDQQAAAFRAELEANPERRKLAEELQAAAAALEANVVSPGEAEQRTEALELAPVPSEDASADRRAPRAERPRYLHLQTVLRYAAVVVVAFGIGFLARGWVPEAGPSAGSVGLTYPPVEYGAGGPPVEVPTAINEQYVVKYVRATRSFPESSTFSRTLLALARE